jgi:hypothetical protein
VALPAASEPPQARSMQGSGIHSLAICPEAELMVSGGWNPKELVILEPREFTPLAILEGCTDLNFEAVFLNERFVASGSPSH